MASSVIAVPTESSTVSNAFSFTKKEIDGLPLPLPGRRQYYRDTKVRGLQLAVYSSGRKSFLLFRKIKRRPERILIGPYPDLSIEQARGQASALNTAIAQGKNPADDRRALSSESTLEDAFNLFLDLYKKPKRKTSREDVQQFRRYLAWDTSSRWKVRKLSEIRRLDVENLHVVIGEKHGHYASNRLLSLLQAVFNFARKQGWQGPNPAEGADRFTEEKRKRFIEPDEFPRFWKALHSKQTKADFRDFILFTLFTGARRRNVASSRWDEMNLAAGEKKEKWTIPGTKTKNGEPLSIILSSETVQILKRRKKSTASEWVFPSTHPRRKSKSGHFEEPKSQWKELLDRAGIKDLRLHDLRRTFGSWQAAQGTSSIVIGKSLGHLSQASTRIYTHLVDGPVREAVTQANAAMVAAGRAKQSSSGRKRKQ